MRNHEQKAESSIMGEKVVLSVFSVVYLTLAGLLRYCLLSICFITWDN